MPPVPKPAALRQRRNRTSTAATLEAAPAVRVELPEGYSEPTARWWETIWDSPMAGEWVDADVPGLLAVARLVEDFWTAEAAVRPKIAAEIRLQQREYGLSPLSRRQLQWEIRRIEAAKPPAERSRQTKSLLRVLEA